MNDLYFWNRWNKEHRTIYLALLSLFVLSILLSVIAYFIGERAVIGWDISSVMEPFMVTVDTFTKNLFDFSVDVESYVLKQTYFGTGVRVNLWSAYTYFIFFVLSFLIGVVVTTYLSSFSYFVGTGIIMLVLVTMNFDLLEIAGFQDKIPAAVAIALIVGLSYYFKEFRKETSFLWRLISFAGVLLVLALLIGFGTKVHHPILYLTNFGIIGPICITLLFMAMNGFELINVFLYLTAGSVPVVDSKNRIFNFILISGLYLGNVLLLLLKKMLILNWDILIINPFLILVLSSFAGIWGYKKRAILFNDMLPFRPYGALFFLAAGILAFATIGYAFITGNDPLYECFEYGIIYTHLFFGTIYFLYVLFNFGILFNKKISIYDIVYKPVNLPFFMVRGIGGAAIIAIWLYSNRFALYLGLAGYYNFGGDVYLHENNILLAKQYYRSASTYEFQNHRSNYTLACLLGEEKNRDGQVEYLVNANIKKPFEYAYVNLSNLYLRENAYFQAIFIAQEGLSKFPNSTALANNLAVMYTRTDLVDSIFYYLNKSIQNGKDEPVPAVNMMYVILQKNLLSTADSLLKGKDFPQDEAYLSNKLLLQTQLRQAPVNSEKTYTGKEILSPVSYATLYNFGVSHLNGIDAGIHFPILDSIIKNPANDPYGDGLQVLRMLKLYYNGNAREAFIALENSKNVSTNPFFKKLAGVWMMEQEAYLPASENFKETFSTGGTSAQMNYAMAMCEAHQFSDAATLLQTLKESPDTNTRAVASDLQELISKPSLSQVLSWPDLKKTRYLHLTGNMLEEPEMLSILESIKQVMFSRLAASECIHSLIQQKKVQEARKVFEKTDRSDTVRAIDTGMLDFALLELLEAEQNWKELDQVASKIYLTRSRENQRSYFKAIASEGLGNLTAAEKSYLEGIMQAPYFDKGIISAVDFYNKQKQTGKGYDLIADAVQFNPTSNDLLKAYAIQALRNNLSSYGEDALLQLKERLPAQEYSTFEKEFKALLAETEASFQSQ